MLNSIKKPWESPSPISTVPHRGNIARKTVFWSLAYVDWNTDSQPTHDQAYAKLLPRIHDGAIVLLHSTSRTNAEILDELLSKWEEMGYTFKSLNDLPGVV